jgi:hypothetical protein
MVLKVAAMTNFASGTTPQVCRCGRAFIDWSAMARKASARKPAAAPPRRPSALIDTRVIYCGDNLEQLAKLPEGCIDLMHQQAKRWKS